MNAVTLSRYSVRIDHARGNSSVFSLACGLFPRRYETLCPRQSIAITAQDRKKAQENLSHLCG